MANSISISNVINVSVLPAAAGAGNYNTSNIALFTRDAHASTFGTLGYAIYKSPTQVGVDFGTSSQTYQMAVSIFSQAPNILANGGYLVIIPMLATAQTAVQKIAFPAIAASGAFKLNYGMLQTASIAWNASAATIEGDLQALAGLSSVTVTGSIASQDLEVTFTGVSGAATLLTVSSNTLADASSDPITPVVTTVVIGSTNETLDAAINRTVGLVAYFGVMIAEITIQTVMLAAAAVIQSLNKIAFFVSYTLADIQSGGMIDLLRSGGFTQSRGLYYGDVTVTALNYMASYAGRALSVNFSGSNTTLDMHLKSLATVQPDPSMTQTILNLAQAAGADVYINFEVGLSKVFASGANRYFDQVYNQQWIVGALQIAGFNLLAGTATKIPQTESGVGSLKAAYRRVCQQGVANQYLAPGDWNSPDTFGNLTDFYANISQRGYYIYSAPVSQQPVADRNARKAPLIQIALKEAGAIDSSDVIISINA